MRKILKILYSKLEDIVDGKWKIKRRDIVTVALISIDEGILRGIFKIFVLIAGILQRFIPLLASDSLYLRSYFVQLLGECHKFSFILLVQ